MEKNPTQNKRLSCEIHIFLWKVWEPKKKVEERKKNKSKREEKQSVERTFPSWTCRVSNAGEFLPGRVMRNIWGGQVVWQLWLWQTVAFSSLAANKIHISKENSILFCKIVMYC